MSVLLSVLPCPCVHVCISFVHIRSWPRIRSLYALYMLLANSACVLQVVGLACGRLRLEFQRRDVDWVPGLTWGWLGLSGSLCNELFSSEKCVMLRGRSGTARLGWWTGTRTEEELQFRKGAV
jgi:hypothetical protein